MAGQSTSFFWSTFMPSTSFFGMMFGGGSHAYRLEVLDGQGGRLHWETVQPGEGPSLARRLNPARQGWRFIQDRRILFKLPRGSSKFPLTLSALVARMGDNQAYDKAPWLIDENTIAVNWSDRNAKQGQSKPVEKLLLYSLTSENLVDVRPSQPNAQRQTRLTPDGAHTWTFFDKTAELVLREIATGKTVRTVALQLHTELTFKQDRLAFLELVAVPDAQDATASLILIPRNPEYVQAGNPPGYFEVNASSGELREIPYRTPLPLTPAPGHIPHHTGETREPMKLKITAGAFPDETFAFQYWMDKGRLEVLELRFKGTHLVSERRVRTAVAHVYNGERITFLPEASLAVVAGYSNYEKTQIFDLSDGRLLNEFYPYDLDGSPRARVSSVRARGTQLLFEITYEEDVWVHDDPEDEAFADFIGREAVGDGEYQHPNEERLKTAFADEAWQLRRPARRHFRFGGTVGELRSSLSRSSQSAFQSVEAQTPIEEATPIRGALPASTLIECDTILTNTKERDKIPVPRW